MVRLGFHLSIAGSVANAPRTAMRMGYGTFQMFASSSRAWKDSRIGRADVAEFKAALGASGAVPYAHIPYLCNPSSTSRTVYRKSVGMLVKNMQKCEALGIGGLVVHIGSHLGKGLPVGISNACDAVMAAIDGTDYVKVLLENTAGYRNSVGSRFSEIGRIIDTVGSDRVGVCLDTCHAFAAGYDIRTDEGVEKVAGEFDGQIGLRRLGVVHLNDAKFGLGSRLDRHWHIGKGNIGRKGFVALFRSAAFGRGNFIMETPINEFGNEATNFGAASEAVRLAGKEVEA